MADVLKDRRGDIITEIHCGYSDEYDISEVFLESGEIVGWNYCDLMNGAEHHGKYCDAYNWRHSPIDGEETVEEMAETTGENTEMVPRVTFRDAQDAEMVVESLRNSTIHMGTKGAQIVKVWAAAQVINAMGGKATVMLDTAVVKDPYNTAREIAEGVAQLCGLMDIVTTQLVVLLVPDNDSVKYVNDLRGYIAETRKFADSLSMTADELNKKSGE